MWSIFVKPHENEMKQPNGTPNFNITPNTVSDMSTSNAVKLHPHTP